MFDVEKVFQAETSFYDSFTDRVDTVFGKLYYNPQNPSSHDSNHAHILRDLDDPENALIMIKRFYRGNGIIPRIYSSFIKDELELLRPHMESAGFTISTWEENTFLFPPESTPIMDSTSPIRRITTITDDIIDLIHSEDEGDWTINVLKNHVSDDQFHLLGLYEAEKLVTIASVKTLDGYSRVDDVVTHKEYRGQHFGTKMMEYLVAYHRSISDNYLYLWAVNPVAIKMYINIGFKEFQTNRPFWSAYIAW